MQIISRARLTPITTTLKRMKRLNPIVCSPPRMTTREWLKSRWSWPWQNPQQNRPLVRPPRKSLPQRRLRPKKQPRKRLWLKRPQRNPPQRRRKLAQRAERLWPRRPLPARRAPENLTNEVTSWPLRKQQRRRLPRRLSRRLRRRRQLPRRRLLRRKRSRPLPRRQPSSSCCLTSKASKKARREPGLFASENSWSRNRSAKSPGGSCAFLISLWRLDGHGLRLENR